VGAFLVVGVLIVISGLWKPLGRLVSLIPMPIANAMLAGVLLSLCLAPVKAVAADPLTGLAVVLTWLLVGLYRKVLAVPAAVLVAAVIIGFTTPLPPSVWEGLMPSPIFVTPTFSFQAVVGTALPLFLVTMAAQNISGMAVLAANDYKPEFGPVLRNTGVFTILAAPFGGHGVNLAAITAALCSGPEAEPDRDRRYWAAVANGASAIVVGLVSGAAAAFIAAAPPILIQAVAGLALIGAFGASAASSLHAPESREAAVVTFIVTASGVGFLGIPGAFWGLVAGIALHLANRLRLK
jgi:benzoate membrane transport protein